MDTEAEDMEGQLYITLIFISNQYIDINIYISYMHVYIFIIYGYIYNKIKAHLIILNWH